MKKTQKEKLLKLIKTKRWIKVQQMHKIAWRYGHILWVLRKEGYKFLKRKQKDCWLEEWKLVK